MDTTRRECLAAISGLLLSPVRLKGDSNACLQCGVVGGGTPEPYVLPTMNPAKVRQSVQKLMGSASAWQAFIRANGGLPLEIRLALARWHAACCSASPDLHRTPNFLPWHRLILHLYERALQQSDPNVTVPYWDWDQVDWAVPAPYLTEPSLQPINDAGVAVPRGDISPGNKESLAASVTTLLSLSPDAFFRKAAYGAHYQVHTWSGAVMGSLPNAAYDPLFFIHHARMDALWTQWKKINQVEAITDEMGIPDCITFNDVNDQNKSKFVTGADLWDESKLGYQYDFGAQFLTRRTKITRSISFEGIDLSPFPAQHHQPSFFSVRIAGSGHGGEVTFIALWPLHEGVRKEISWTAVIPEHLKLDAKTRFVIAPTDNLGRPIGRAVPLRAKEVEVSSRFHPAF